MKSFILFDSNFNLALMDKGDLLHEKAVFVFRKIWEYRERIKIILPPLCINEVVFTLKRKGVSQRIIEEKILKLINSKEIIVLSTSEISSLKYCKLFPENNSKKSALKTNDSMIVGIGMDLEAQIITFDRIMWQKTKAVYKDIYYLGDRDEEACFLKEFKDSVDPFSF